MSVPPPPYPPPPEDPPPRPPSRDMPSNPPGPAPTGQPPTYPAPQPVYPGPGMYPQAPPTSNLAVASLVGGIASLFCTPIGLPLGIAALIAGFIARSRIGASGGYQQGDGLALAGIIAGSISILLD